MSKISANIAYGPEAPGSNDGPCAMWVEPYRNTLITQHLSSWAKKTMHPYHNEEDTNNLLQRPAELAARMMNATEKLKKIDNKKKALCELLEFRSVRELNFNDYF